MIKVIYNNIEGLLNLETDEVYFYHFKYKNIGEAVKTLENDVQCAKKEIEIFDNLIKGLDIS